MGLVPSQLNVPGFGNPSHRRSYPFRGVDSGELGEQGVRSGERENCDVMQDKKIK